MGHHVVGLDNFSDYYSRASKEANIARAVRQPDFRLIEGELRDVELERLLGGVDGVFHLAGRPGVRRSWGIEFEAYLDANVRATHRLLEALTATPVPMVFASSSSVYGGRRRQLLSEDDRTDPISPYGYTKLAAETLVSTYRREHGLPVITLRYFSVYGPRQRPDMAFHRFITAALSGRPVPLYGAGHQSRDFTYVGDVVRATIAALRGPSAVYNIGGGAPVTVNRVLALIAEMTGRRPTIDREPAARGDVPHTWADISRARDELEWQPMTGLTEGIREQIADSARRLGAHARRLAV